MRFLKLRKKILISLISLAVSKHSIAASGVTAFAGVVLAETLGFDPWTWILGALGGVIVRAKLPPTNRLDGIANGIISVLLAGVIAPVVANKAAMFTSYADDSLYGIALVLAGGWPWLFSLLWGKFGEAIDGALRKWGLK